jgi:23S rRNA (uracil1939-C5)-methyltransferase
MEAGTGLQWWAARKLYGSLRAVPEIEKLVYGGDGLVRDRSLGDGRAKVAFIPFSLPGEVWENGSLLAASPERIEPGCEYFTRCGGCHYQHMGDARQLAAKREILGETLQRLGRIAIPEIRTVSAAPWGYRNRIQLHFHKGQMGFHEAGSRKLVAISRCPIASPTLERAIEALREMRRQPRFPRFLESVELFTNETETLVNVLESERPVARGFFDWAAELIPGATLSSLDYPTAGGSFRVGHKSFFQVNRFLVDALVEQAIPDARGEWALDLYAGVGLFSRPLLERFSRVTAVEVVRSAAQDFVVNVPDAEIVQKPTEDFLAGFDGRPDFVLADPPRAGLGKRTVTELIRIRPRRLTIVSCDPSTLARDLALLAAAGFTLDSLTMADLFPQTFHIETIARLSG